MSEETSGNFFVELLKFALIAVIIVVPVRLFVAQPFIVSGESMSPTFETGQYLIVDELSYHFSQPQRGDVIIFRYPRNPSEFFIKRIVGLPGETVNITDSAISVVEQGGAHLALSEPYIANKGNGGPESITLKSDQYFVMGDNRPDSSDSRYWGPLPRQNIIGRAFLRLLPLSQAGFFPGSASFPAPAQTATSGSAYSTFVDHLPALLAKR